MRVVLHSGREPYVAPSPDPYPALGVQTFVDDLSQKSEADIRARAMPPLATVTLLCLRFLRHMSAEEGLAALERWSDLRREIDGDPGPPTGAEAIGRLLIYALEVLDSSPSTIHATFERILQRRGETMNTAADRLRREGSVAILTRQLRRRFGALPESVVDRFERATDEQIARWAERILDAVTLDAVFAPA